MVLFCAICFQIHLFWPLDNDQSVKTRSHALCWQSILIVFLLPRFPLNDLLPTDYEKPVLVWPSSVHWPPKNKSTLIGAICPPLTPRVRNETFRPCLPAVQCLKNTLLLCNFKCFCLSFCSLLMTHLVTLGLLFLVN